MEKLATDEAGSKGLEVEAAPASQDVNGLFRMSVSDAGTGANVGVSTSVDACDKISLESAATGGMSCRAAATASGLKLV